MVPATRRAYAGRIAALVAALLALGSEPRAHNRISQVTWTTDVQPIVQARCLSCHSPGGFGPMSLATYPEAREWAKAIREEVLERRMPPWPAAPGFGDFANDRSLTSLEIELLTAWADGATPLGPPIAGAQRTGAAPSARPPDLVVTMPVAREIGGSIERLELPTNQSADRFIAGWEFLPGNRSIIEQAVLSIAPHTPLGTWTPGDPPMVYPAGVAQRLPAGARVALELHYRKSATPQTDRSGVAFNFGGKPRRELRHRRLPCLASTLDRDVEALALTPRAAEAGASIEIAARRADGSVEALAVVPRYEPAYPVTYRFRRAVRLGRGTVIDVRSASAACGADLDFVDQ
jgi:mono/diheme cytochrome c family protein